ncbi:MAG: stage II sporulation protein R, partial [Clostridia bacterium]|nr:stage II sporulation protein R [Clostridia bacterium]
MQKLELTWIGKDEQHNVEPRILLHDPTKDYGGFSLPAGSYDSLRVILGDGEGHNWWCVVFPPIC